MWCVKCRKHTETSETERTVTKNNRHMLRGKCMVCGSVKTQFIKKSAEGAKKGSGLVNDAINNLPFEMHLPGHNFTGPGTKLKKRLKPDGMPKSWSKPINRVDEASMHHDICYANNTDTETRNYLCDKNMLNELEGIYNPSLREKLDKSIVKNIIGSKMKLGFGILKKPKTQ